MSKLSLMAAIAAVHGLLSNYPRYNARERLEHPRQTAARLRAKQIRTSRKPHRLISNQDGNVFDHRPSFRNPTFAVSSRHFKRNHERCV